MLLRAEVKKEEIKVLEENYGIPATSQSPASFKTNLSCGRYSQILTCISLEENI